MYTEILEMAHQWANVNHPTASPYHKAAFANAVSYLVSGLTGGYGGPSLREHLVSWSLGTVGSASLHGTTITVVTPGDLPRPGKWTFGEAVKFSSPLCFDPAENYKNILLQIQEREYCFDDDPEDLAALRRS